ncbi:hypothetical protein O181_077723 [Austropuccinia psidii MF-1]|uniref:Cyanovirin-N domain-containing protein n=1 Tax=Austropuccinia psidii MF-1 TaxID=1389203 RepID=A0A9Q3FDC1_9BASI|nr:hypothetical protein [Austropuccinia psidii MF-1]
MFSFILSFQGLIPSTLILACQVVFVAADNNYGIGGGWQYPQGSRHVRCDRGYQRASMLDTYCRDDSSATYRCNTLDCYWIGPDGGQNLADTLSYENCHANGTSWAQVQATAFIIPSELHQIDVIRGDPLGTGPPLPQTGVACAWSDVRPECDSCDEHRNS